MTSKAIKPIHILLADDDKDDGYFFIKALEEIQFDTRPMIVEDGEKLMNYLKRPGCKLPDVLFLDLNMPRKNGMECLLEIKAHTDLKDLPVIIYSTSLHEDVADLLYKNGAHYYVRKTDHSELKKILRHIFGLMAEGRFNRPLRNKFIANLVEV